MAAVDEAVRENGHAPAWRDYWARLWPWGEGGGGLCRTDFVCAHARDGQCQSGGGAGHPTSRPPLPRIVPPISALPPHRSFAVRRFARRSFVRSPSGLILYRQSSGTCVPETRSFPRLVTP